MKEEEKEKEKKKKEEEKEYATDIWPTKPKMFIIWHFPEKDSLPLF